MYIEESISFEDFIWEKKKSLNFPKYFSFSLTQICYLKNMNFENFSICNIYNLVEDYAM